MINGTTPVLDITDDLGLSVTYSFNNTVKEMLGGGDYINAQWYYPLAKINFKRALFPQSIYNYLKGFFSDVNGSQDIFCFADPIDNLATYLPFDTSLGITTQGKIVVSDGRYQLVKRYSLVTISGTYYIDRPITRPQEGSLTFYTVSNVLTTATVNYDTGEVLTGGGTAVNWQGNFYLPVRLENDLNAFNFLVKDSYDDVAYYALPDLVLLEVKENSFPYPNNIAQSYDHHWQLDLPVDTEINDRSFTDITKFESGYESRAKSRNAVTEVIFPPQNINFNGTTKESEYVIGLYRLCFGTFAHIFLTDTDFGIDDEFRFKDDLTFKTISDYTCPSGTSKIVELSGLIFKEDDFAIKTNYCFCWLIQRIDETIVSYTNHDRNIAYEGNIYTPQSSYTATSPSRTSELSVDTSELKSSFNTEVTETELLNGLYKNANVKIFIWNWFDNTNLSYIYNGEITSYSVGYLLNLAKDYQLNLSSLSYKLDVAQSVKTSSSCQVAFLSQGLNKCNKSIDGTVRVTRTLTGVNTDGSIVNIDTAVGTNYAYGTISFDDGPAQGNTIYITAVIFAGTEIQLLYPPNSLPLVGDTVTLTRGCGKQPQDCSDYGNIANFQGFPRLPSIDNIANTAEV